MAYDGPLAQDKVQRLQCTLERSPIHRKVVTEQIAVIIPDLAVWRTRGPRPYATRPAISSSRNLWRRPIVGFCVPLAVQDRVTAAGGAFRRPDPA